MDKEKKPTNKAEQDPNFVAYMESFTKGNFKILNPETLLAYTDGVLIGVGLDRLKLSEKLIGTDVVRNSKTGLEFFRAGGLHTYHLPSSLIKHTNKP